MITEQKRTEIISKMLLLKDKKRLEFRDFLVEKFNDDDLRDLTPNDADKILSFLSKL